MGGHDHGLGPLAKVPSPDIYKVEDAPELVKLRERLAEKGLKDPWIRNEVWRFTAFKGRPHPSVSKVLTRGFSVAIPAFLITLAVEKYFGITYGTSHHDEGHKDDHH